MKHRVYRMPLYNNDGIDELNQLLEDGWLVKEMQTVAENEAAYAVFVLEKVQ